MNHAKHKNQINQINHINEGLKKVVFWFNWFTEPGKMYKQSTWTMEIHLPFGSLNSGDDLF